MLRALTLATQHNVAIHKAQHEASNIWRPKRKITTKSIANLADQPGNSLA